MRLRGKAAASGRVLLSALLTTAVFAATDTPTIHVSEFAHQPADIKYFRNSDVILFLETHGNAIYRTTDAGATWKVVEELKGKAYSLVMHEFDPDRAYVLTDGTHHFRTHDKGQSWTKFDSGATTSAFRDDTLHFHAGDPDRIIFNGMDCLGIICGELATYTKDGFKSKATDLRADTSGCWWAKSSAEFTTGEADLDADRVVCITKDFFSPFKEDQRIFISDNFFQKDHGHVQEFEPDMDTSQGVQGVVNLAVVKKHMLVATSSFNTDEMALFVTDDTKKWHRAMFPTNHGHKLNQEAYTILESTNYSIQIDVMTTFPSNPLGVMFTSNSNGTFFTENIEYTNRNPRGNVDFEKISGIQGIFLVNTVENGQEVEKEPRKAKKIVTKITYDDGRTFEDVKAGSERIHLHSVTDLDNIGRVFSSPAPGLVLGNGNTGAQLHGLADANLYVSDNAGLTWKEAQKGPHKYEFGDEGSVLLAVKDSDSIKGFSYSLDHGQNWKSVNFPDELSVTPVILTTTQDSSSLKFLLLAKSGGNPKYYLISIDFEGLHERTCEASDMEDWHARVDKDGNPSCLMGHKQSYRRRKKTADCFIKKEFSAPVAETEDCECTDLDFECDYNFVRKDDKCEAAGPIIDSEKSCKNREDTFKGSSGWRLIPGNTCKRKSGPQKDEPVERKCSDSTSPPSRPADGKVTHKQFNFESQSKDFEKVYLEKGDSSSEGDETVIVAPVKLVDQRFVPEKLWLTKDHGKNWERILKDNKVQGIYPNTYFKDAVFFTTDEKMGKGVKVIYTIDRGNHFHEFGTDAKPANVGNPFAFHPDKKDWIIFLGQKCESVGDSCFTEAFLSTDRGDHWKTIAHYVSKCEFTGHSAYKYRDIKQIVCSIEDREGAATGTPKRIVMSDNFFDDKVFPKLPDGSEKSANVKDFATMSEFIVVAAEEASGGDGLVALASMDGKTYAQAHFPANFRPDHSSEYTVLDSSTHAVNLFVATETKSDRQYGNIVKSNSNGTSYVVSAYGVNCNERFYVDFERIPGLEGVTLINTVSNRQNNNEPKKLQTKITHNDGAEWAYLAPPRADKDGKGFSCSSSTGQDSCALHLHHYTERDDKRKTFSVATAVGVMFGVGNVGPHLGPLKDADTYMTVDAGVTWKQVQKGEWTWQYGDQGSIIVLVQRWHSRNKVTTKKILYSTDQGDTWHDYEFSNEEIAVTDITSVRSGSSRNFLLWVQKDDGALSSINLDFTGLASRPCEEKDGDYDTWSPKHPQQDNDCLFGHVSKYLRKKKGRECYNDQRVKHDVGFEKCACTRKDFECDFNFEPDSHGQCDLVDDNLPLTAKQWCEANPDAFEYYPSSGYRRIPLTTCEGGEERDKQGVPIACEGHQDEFERAHRVSGATIFFAIAIPFALAGAAGWWVWRNWEGKFGQIRLGEPGSLDGDSPWVKYPVIAVSAIVAVGAAIPLIVSSLWRSATSMYQRVGGGSGGSWLSAARGPRRFTTRDSFARGARDYDIVDEDEGELLGDDSDEEV